jgi:alpha-beta hydrolase superfamily lysophospholipase
VKTTALFFLGWVLAACASLTAPAGPAATTPQLAQATFVTSDGLQLPVRSWLPDAAPRAVVVALHGFNDYSKAFDKVPGAIGLGPYLRDKGVAVFAYDQRGFGASPYHGLWPGSDALVGDFDAFVAVIHQRYPGVPVYALGESMGGAVVMSALTRANAPQVAAAILVAPAVWARATMPAVYRVALWMGARIVPGWRPTGRSFGRMASDNIAMLRDNGRDPLFIKETRIDSVYGLVGLMDEAYAAAGNLRVPTLYLYGANDEIIPAKASAAAMSFLLQADPQARGAFYEYGWHMMLRDKNGPNVLDDIAVYINDRTAPLPSGADDNALARLDDAAKHKRKRKKD